MTEYAIETQALVKQFQRKETKDSASGGANSGATGGANNGANSGAKKRGFWPFARKPKTETSTFTAVAGVDLQIRQGEVFGLLGPNGAGKSTTIRMLCTLLEPTSGTAHVNGYDVVREATRVRQSLGTVLAGERSIYWKLTARENLEYFAALYHIPPEVAKKRANELLERMELTARADDLVEKFSTGMRQRVAISKALIARPPILLLDEPTLGLDPQAARRVRELVSELKAEGHTILLTTHYMEEADLLSDRIGIIDQGKIIALGTPAALKERIQQKDVIRLEIAGWHDDLGQRMQAMGGVENLVARKLEAAASGGASGENMAEVTLYTENSRSVLPGLIEKVNFNGTRLVNMNIVKPSLEDVFIQLTGKALRD
jgi:ABC-2 type transport system ATP-binding protein